MQPRFRSGDCRWVPAIAILVMLACISVAGAANCAAGCTCLSPADAKAKGLSYCNGQQSICGYDNSQNALYCYGNGLTLVTARMTMVPFTVVTTAAPVCPSGCDCLTDAAATSRYGSYTRCTEQVCGYETVLTHVADPIPKYCVKQGNAQTCPGDCECMFETAAREKFGTYGQCSATPCYSVATGSAMVNAYCFKPTTVSPPASCPTGCECLSDATVAAKGGTWDRCSADICGYEQSSSLAAVVQVPKYCRKPQAPVCPAGCACVLGETAELNGMVKCDPNAAPCGYQPGPLAYNSVGSEKPLYCYKMGTTTTVTPAGVCPNNCGCMSEKAAKEKFGTYNQCSTTVCGYENTATTANRIPQYCFGPGTAVTPTVTPASVCPENCGCMSEAAAREKFGTYNQCSTIFCGYEPSGTPPGVPQYCFGPGTTVTAATPAPIPCTCDPTHGSCTGSCPESQSCTMTATTADVAGKLTCTSCACTATCTLNADNTCSGICPTGAPCTATFVKDDSGMETVSCGCGGPSAPTQQVEQQQDIVATLGNFFRSLFGWK